MMFSFSRLRAVPVAAAAVVLLATAHGAHAQVNYGAVRGTVKDPQGATIRGAEVTLTNVDTKVAHSITSNDSGAFLFGAVDPGTYTVKVAISGFKTYEQTGIIVTLGNTQTADAMLPIADAAGETVEVTAESVTLNTANASAAQIFSEQQIQDLPSLGRNPFMFATLAANVVTLGDPRYVRAEDSTGSSQVSLSGAPSGSNSYEVDGIPVSTSSGGETFVVSPDAVSNAKVSADTFDAAIGRSGGGVFATSFKSGSAQYHGTLYGETRQTPWSANSYFNGGHATPSDETYLYSGAFGGPIPFAQKNRWLKDTFFWVTEEGYRQGQPNTGTNSFYVPTVAERAGDFSADSVTVYDPMSYNPATGTRMSYLQETGKNAIPASAINPIGSYVASIFPSPTNSNLYGAPSSAATNNACTNALNWCLPSQSIKTRSDEYIGKLEHTFAPWWTSSVSYLHDAVQEPDIDFHLGSLPAGTPYAGSSTKLIRYFDATSQYNTFTLNPTTLLTVGYGFNRYYSASPPYSEGFNANTGFGGAGFPTALTGNMASKTFPTFTLTNTSNAAPIGGSFSGPGIQASHNFVATISKTIGKHDLRVGYVWRGFSYYTNPQSGSAGAYTFTGQNTSAAGTSVSANGPLAIADLLVGQPSTATMQINAGPFYNRETYNSVFVQDDFRMSSKLTLNFGLRYELEEGQYEASNKYNVGFNPNATGNFTAAAGAVTTKGGLDFAGVNGAPVHCCDNGKNHFSPRIGAAYQLNGKTVMHTGYGIFFAPVGINTAATQGYSQVSTYTIGAITAVPLTTGAGAYLSSPFNGGTALLQPSGSSLGALTGIGGALGTVATYNRKYPSVQQYMLDVQRQLPYDIIMTVSYIGAHGTHFINTENINQAPDSVLATYATSATAGNNLSTPITNPYYTTNNLGGIYPAAGFGFLARSSYAKGQFQLPYPQFGGITAQVANGNSSYNSLAVKGEKRLSKGLSVLATYTWSSNWDTIWATGSQVYYTYGPQDIYNTKAERARSINSVPNRVTMAITDQLPFGKGHMFLGNPHGFAGHALDAVVGGWELNYEQIIQNGVPMTITQSDLSSGTYGITGIGGAYQRPNITNGDPHSVCYSGKPQNRINNYMNASALTPATTYTYGNAPRNLPCRAPGSDTATASLNKTFSLGERLKLQARFEALNLYNTPQFGPSSTTSGLVASPNALATNPVTAAPTVSTTSSQTFGKNITQIGFGRVVQMGGRLTF